jgi:hypothetical protein
MPTTPNLAVASITHRAEAQPPAHQSTGHHRFHYPYGVRSSLFAPTISGLAVALLLFFAWLWIRKQRAAFFHDSKAFDRRPRLEEETPALDSRAKFRHSYATLTLKERNQRDRRIAAALVKKWRRKGLP